MSIPCIFPKALLSLLVFINSNTYLIFDFSDAEPSQSSWRYTEAARPCPVARANQEKLRARNSGKNTVVRNIFVLYRQQGSFLGNFGQEQRPYCSSYRTFVCVSRKQDIMKPILIPPPKKIPPFMERKLLSLLS